MKQDKNMKPFDNLLLAYLTREGQDTFVSSSYDKEAEIIFSKKFNIDLPKTKVETLMSTLTESLSQATLGSLVESALSETAITAMDIQTKTGLSDTLLEDIKADMAFTNSIPVRSLVKLLKLLNVSSEKAVSAINATFDKLTAESKMFLSIPSNVQPAFRKGASHNDSTFDFKRVKSDEGYLYQNKEALDKYIKRFSELYNEL